MLTDTNIRQAKAGETPRKLSDSGGLFVLIQPNGSKLWRQAYRYSGKQRTLAHGAYPQVTLADARKARDAAKELLAKGIDPNADKAMRKHHTGDTLEAVAREVIAKQKAEGKAPRTLFRLEWLLALAKPLWGRKLSEIEAPELLGVCRGPEKAGHYETALRLRALLSTTFRFGIATGRARRDPANDLRGTLATPTVTHRPAVTEPEQVGALMRAIGGYDGEETTRLALQLLALTFVRPGELRHGQWAEIDFDNEVWTIPPWRMKKKLRPPHKVPLSAQAIAILHKLHAITGSGKYMFPSLRTPGRPMSENTLNAALRRLGYASNQQCSHGFRAIASTILNEMKLNGVPRFNADAIEHQLAHQDDDESRRPYMRAKFWAERVEMMTALADELDQLRADIRHIRKAAAP